MKFYYSHRKQYLTLLETLIAMSLLSILLTFVFGFFRELTGLTTMTEKAQRESFHMRYVESRLDYIFQRIVNENEKMRKFYFYTEPAHSDFSPFPSLVFTFNNEVRLDPTFSGDLIGRLYLDLDHRLCLVTWPIHILDPHQYFQQEVLLTDVTKLFFSFYSPPARTGADRDIQPGEGKESNGPTKIPEKDKWIEHEWELAFKQMPGILKIVVEVAKNPKDLEQQAHGINVETNVLSFAFVLPASKNVIYYPPD